MLAEQGMIRRYEAKPSKYFEETQAIVRKVARIDKKIGQIVCNELIQQDKKLAKRREYIFAEADAATQRQQYQAIKEDGKSKFLLETDENIRKNAQLLANKQFYEAKIQETLPQWVHMTKDVEGIVKHYGHANELNWRSKAAEKLDLVIQEVALNPHYEESRIQLSSLRLQINAMLSNEFLRQLRDIVDKFVVSLNDNSMLSISSKALKETKAAKENTIVPLPTGKWSQDLVENRLQQDRQRPQSPTLDCVATMKMHGAFIMNGQLHELDRNRPKIQANEYDKIRNVVAFKKAASDGDFEKAVLLFHKAYRPHHGAKKSDYVRIPPTLETFKTLMCAFKNAKQIVFENGYKIIDMMEKWGFQPDVTVFNIMLQACESQSRWRRAVAILESMKKTHNVLPNRASMKILLNCCRYAMDDAGMMYDELRRHNLSQRFCQKAASNCARNKLSGPLLEEAIRDARKAFAPPVESVTGSDNSEIQPSSTELYLDHRLDVDDEEDEIVDLNADEVSRASSGGSQNSQTMKVHEKSARVSGSLSSSKNSSQNVTSESKVLTKIARNSRSANGIKVGTGALERSELSLSAISSDYKSSVAMASTKRRLGKVTALVPTMKLDEQTAEIMQWKHVVATMKDTLPYGSLAKQARPFDATDISFQTKLFRSLPGINGTINSVPAFVNSLTDSNVLGSASLGFGDSGSVSSADSASTVGSDVGSTSVSRRLRKHGKLMSTGKKSVFSRSKPVDAMTTSELTKAVHESINTSLEKSGYLLQNVAQSDVDSTQDSIMKFLSQSGGSVNSEVSKLKMTAVLSPMAKGKLSRSASPTITTADIRKVADPPHDAVSTMNFRTFSPDSQHRSTRYDARMPSTLDEAPHISLAEHAGTICISSNYDPFLDDKKPQQIATSSRLYPARMGVNNTEVGDDAATLSPLSNASSPGEKHGRIRAIDKQKEQASAVLSRQLYEASRALPRNWDATDNPEANIKTGSSVDSVSGRFVGSASQVSFDHSMTHGPLLGSSRDGSRQNTAEAIESAGRSPSIIERYRQAGEKIVLSTAKKLRAKVETERSTASRNKLPYADRSDLPQQNEKVVPPVELLYNPARMPLP